MGRLRGLSKEVKGTGSRTGPRPSFGQRVTRPPIKTKSPVDNWSVSQSTRVEFGGTSMSLNSWILVSCLGIPRSALCCAPEIHVGHSRSREPFLLDLLRPVGSGDPGRTSERGPVV